jgi:septation ring formation regulator EzrA
MDNDEMLINIKVMFDEKVDEVKRHMGVIAEHLETKIQTVAEGYGLLDRKIDALDEKLSNKIDEVDRKLSWKILSVEDTMNRRFEAVDKRFEGIEKRFEGIDDKIGSLQKDMTIVKDYVIRVDTRLNEHEIILKRVK